MAVTIGFYIFLILITTFLIWKLWKNHKENVSYRERIKGSLFNVILTVAAILTVDLFVGEFSGRDYLIIWSLMVFGLSMLISHRQL